MEVEFDDQVYCIWGHPVSIIRFKKENGKSSLYIITKLEPPGILKDTSTAVKSY